MAQSLTELAARHRVAAVLMNQVTTRVNDATGSAQVVPALGDSWAHACNVQAMLEWRDGERHARLYKGAMSEAVPYVVTSDGVRAKPKPAAGGEATGVKRPAEWGAERERSGAPPPTGYAAPHAEADGGGAGRGGGGGGGGPPPPRPHGALDTQEW